jgi:hypothetical protein
MLYRDHRGSLADSMDTVREFNTLDELQQYLSDEWKHSYKGIDKKVEEIKIEYIGYDKRINWNTWHVSIRVTNEENFWVAGMLNGKVGDSNG